MRFAAQAIAHEDVDAVNNATISSQISLKSVA
jgi:hypothetical protein